MNPHQKRGRPERLGQIVVAAEGYALNIVILRVLGGEHNDRNIGPFAQHTADCQSVRAGHHYVKNNKIGRLFEKCSHKVIAVFKRRNNVSVPLKEAFDNIPDVFFVVRNID